MIQAVRGLAHAWEQGIIHRDLKPANLMLTTQGVLKIADFGLAKAAFMGQMTQARRRMGTPYYMSPEHGFDAKNVDLRADIYSLGATFYHLVTGQVPFEGSSPIEVGIKVSTSPLPPVRSVNPEVLPTVAAVIEKMLARKPEERYQTAEELLHAIQSLDLASSTTGQTIDVPSGQGTSETPQLWNNSIGMTFVLISPGEFLMGSPELEPGRAGDEFQHTVRIRQPFSLGIYLVTQAQFRRVMEYNPSFYSATGGLGLPGSGEAATKPRPISIWHPQSGFMMVNQDPAWQPVDRVSWEDAREFCRRLSASPEEKSAGRVYRLPTEAEWEYACRAGTTTRFGFGDSESDLGEYVWREGTMTYPVGQKRQNAWGLYDMHGNLYQWCADWYDAKYYEESPMDDPTGPVAGIERVMRGSWFLSNPVVSRSACRFHSNPVFAMHLYGFRVVTASSR